jgi:hypothetical protein
MNRIALGYALCTVLAAWPTASCRKATLGPATKTQQQAPPQRVNELVSGHEEQSCRVFVQRFYDWYWNQLADKAEDPKFDPHKLHTYDDVLRLKPAVLSQELLRLIEKDEARSKAAEGDIVNLDFDPFLNSNGPDGKYMVQAVGVRDGACKASIEGGHGVREVVELKKASSAWIIVNLRYSHYSEDGKTKQFPDDDLIRILNR